MHLALVIRYRRPADRRTRSERWHDTVAELFALPTEYTAWFDPRPANLCDTVSATALQAIIDPDLRDLADIEPSRARRGD